jgi:hypothetical protein
MGKHTVNVVLEMELNRINKKWVRSIKLPPYLL